tara:strand:+ start:214 stop:591 length:378 start_codon:yes stop_codon:yes gene_type:complete
MSTLKADTIQSTGGGAATLTNQAAAKVYIRRDFNNNVTDSSLNIASVTDNALGDQTMNISSAMSAATYSIVGMASRKANSLDFHVVMVHDSADPTTTAYRLRASNLSGSDKDAEFVSTSVDGDLA